MAEDKQEKPVALHGLAMLEALRPPAGWVTDIALGATYSLELPVALAALVSLAGTARDNSEYGLHSAVRALQVLAGRVRILAQQGRIQAPPKQNKLVHLLDQIVRPIAYDERERAFHPKTWLVRWKPEHDDKAPGRWALLVGSRNLTSAQDWDLGVALEGEEGGKGVPLPEVAKYAAWLLGEARDRSFGARAWPALATVNWRGPKLDIEFGFHGAGDIAWKDTALTRLAQGGAKRVLLLSPFLDLSALDAAERALAVARPWDDTPRRLVAGRPDLEDAARSKAGPALLKRIGDVRCLSPSLHGVSLSAADGAVAASVDEAPHAMDFGLHAKAIVVWHGKNDLSVLVGSANLSRRGWTGKNAEAWVKLRGRTDAGESLWDWSRRASSFEASTVDDPTPEEERRRALERALDDFRALVAITPLVLDDTTANTRLRAASPLTLPLRSGLVPLDGVSLSVARLGVPDAPVAWPSGASEVSLGACRVAERSALVVFCVGVVSGETRLENTWVQAVTAEPVIDARRDDEAIAEALGPRQFMAFLNGLLDPSRDDGDASPTEAIAAGSNGSPWRGDERGLSLELLLRAFSRRDRVRLDALREQLGRSIGSYRRASGAADDPVLRELWEAWDAIEKGLLSS